MQTNLPLIFAAGHFDSKKKFSDPVKYPEHSISRSRVVKCYELDLFLDDDGLCFLNGVAYSRKRGAILIAQPGDKRKSALHFKATFLHFGCSDPNIQALIQSVSGFHSDMNYELIEPILTDICNIVLSYSPDRDILAASKLLILLCTLKNHIQINTTNSTNYSAASIVSNAVEFMKMHYMEPITIDDIASHCCLSTPYFHKIFSSSAHTTPNNYLLKIRLSQAKALLSTTDISISDIAIKCGFNSQAYFCDRFRREFSMTPREYRKTSTPI